MEIIKLTTQFIIYQQWCNQYCYGGFHLCENDRKNEGKWWHDMIHTSLHLSRRCGVNFESLYLTQWAHQWSWQTGGFIFPMTGIGWWEIDWSNLAFNKPPSGQRDESVRFVDCADSSGAFSFGIWKKMNEL